MRVSLSARRERAEPGILPSPLVYACPYVIYRLEEPVHAKAAKQRRKVEHLQWYSTGTDRRERPLFTTDFYTKRASNEYPPADQNLSVSSIFLRRWTILSSFVSARKFVSILDRWRAKRCTETISRGWKNREMVQRSIIYRRPTLGFTSTVVRDSREPNSALCFCKFLRVENRFDETDRRMFVFFFCIFVLRRRSV